VNPTSVYIHSFISTSPFNIMLHIASRNSIYSMYLRRIEFVLVMNFQSCIYSIRHTHPVKFCGQAKVPKIDERKSGSSYVRCKQSLLGCITSSYRVMHNQAASLRRRTFLHPVLKYDNQDTKKIATVCEIRLLKRFMCMASLR
jgi:hypothetical protein